MKKVLKQVCCSRCGEFIPPEELALLQGSLCAICDHMRLEAEQIWHDRHNGKKKLKPNTLYPGRS